MAERESGWNTTKSATLSFITFLNPISPRNLILIPQILIVQLELAGAIIALSSPAWFINYITFYLFIYFWLLFFHFLILSLFCIFGFQTLKEKQPYLNGMWYRITHKAELEHSVIFKELCSQEYKNSNKMYG